MTTVILKEAISHLSLDGFFFFIFFHSIRLLLAIFFFVIIYLSLIMWTISFLEFWALLQKASFFFFYFSDIDMDFWSGFFFMLCSFTNRTNNYIVIVVVRSQAHTWTTLSVLIIVNAAGRR